MSVSAPYPVPHYGLQDVISSFNQAIQWIQNIDKDNAVITNPNSSDADRIAAYNDFAALEQQGQKFQTSSPEANAIWSDLNGKFKTYLESITFNMRGVPLETGADFHALSLYDVILAQNKNDLSQPVYLIGIFRINSLGGILDLENSGVLSIIFRSSPDPAALAALNDELSKLYN